MHGGTAESRVVPLKKKSDIREWWAQMMGAGFIPGGVTGIRKGKTEKGVLSGGLEEEVQEERRDGPEIVLNLHLD